MELSYHINNTEFMVTENMGYITMYWVNAPMVYRFSRAILKNYLGSIMLKQDVFECFSLWVGLVARRLRKEKMKRAHYNLKRRIVIQPPYHP
jgi:hypothetical protein